MRIHRLFGEGIGIALSLSLVASLVAAWGADAWVFFRSPEGQFAWADFVHGRESAWRRPEVDNRTLAEVVAGLRLVGVDAYPAMHPGPVLARSASDETVRELLAPKGLETVFLATRANSLTVLCNEDGDPISFLSDEHGFNNPRGLWRSTPVDIVAVGDSFTQGVCVPPDRNMIAHLRKRFPSTINLGTGGNGPLLELATLREFVPTLRPRLVFWFYFEENDLTTDLPAEVKSSVLRAYLSDSTFHQNLISRQNDIDAMLSRIADLSLSGKRDVKGGEAQRAAYTPDVGNRSWGVDLLLLRHLRHRLGMSMREGHRELTQEPVVAPSDDQAIASFRDILAEADRVVRGEGGKLVLVYLPGPKRYYPLPWHPLHGYRLRQRVLALGQELGLSTVDISEAFDRHHHPATLFVHGLAHYNEKGYALAGATLLHWLESADFQHR